MKRLFVLFFLFVVLCVPSVATEIEQTPTVIDIDPGDYSSTMTAGETQVLSPTAIYDSAEIVSEPIFIFESTDPAIAKINALGRITAISEGTTNIRITCEDVTVSFDLTVQLLKIVEIDLGEYQKIMQPDTTQVLSPSAIYSIPNAAADTVYTYTSSNEDVATINALGRITALSEGRTTITVSSDDCEASFRLRVQTDDVVDLDLGEYQQSMVVGATQVLSPTAIYDNPEATQTPIFDYESDDECIASINALGRITGITPGKTRIFVSCEGISKSIDITVKSNEITDLDIEDHEDELEVGKTLALSVTLIPNDLQDKKAAFYSSAPEIATVNENGRITGIAPGKVTITVCCDDVEKTVPLTVKNKTDGITVKEPYVVLKPGNEHKIATTVAPKSAPQALTYHCLDTVIASVSSDGVICAISPGSTSVLISNGDQKAVVSVIVNENTEQSEETPTAEDSTAPSKKPTLHLTKEILSEASNKTFYVYTEDLPIVSQEVLLALYGTNKSLSIDCGNYSMTILGKEIKNAKNEVLTSIPFTETEDGISFLLNEGNQLPGAVLLSLNTSEPYRFLYLYNSALGKWQQLNSYRSGIMTLDTAGQYMLTVKKLTLSELNWWIISACLLAVVILFCIYVVIKKKYWFW